MRSHFLRSAAAALLLAAFFRALLEADQNSYEARWGIIRTGGYTLFLNARGPLSYVTATRSELPADIQDAGEVHCASCQHGVSIPLFSLLGSRNSSVSGAGGDGGFQKALANLRRRQPELRGVYDVKVDERRFSLLGGLYRKRCVEISARAFK